LQLTTILPPKALAGIAKKLVVISEFGEPNNATAIAQRRSSLLSADAQALELFPHCTCATCSALVAEPELQRELFFVFFEAGCVAVFPDDGAMADAECKMCHGNRCCSENEMLCTDFNP
jgi:hypothetical protein